MTIHEQFTPNFKPQKRPKNPEYLRMVRQLPCCICEAYGEPQMSATQAHHPIHGRYRTTRAPDETAIPLCEGHHQGDLDKTKLAIHGGKETWADRYGLDTEWIAATQDKIGGGQ